MGSGRPGIRTWGRWVRSASATSVLCGPPFFSRRWLNWPLHITISSSSLYYIVVVYLPYNDVTLQGLTTTWHATLSLLPVYLEPRAEEDFQVIKSICHKNVISFDCDWVNHEIMTLWKKTRFFKLTKESVLMFFLSYFFIVSNAFSTFFTICVDLFATE